MNRSFTSLLLFAGLLFSSVYAQVPRQISYQGFIANAAGEPLTGNHTLSVKIYSESGTLLHTENFTGIQVERGVFTVLLGSKSALPPSLDFSKTYFLGVTVDGGAEFTPRTQFASAPYALRAAIADEVGQGSHVVTSANGISGAVKITGAGATTVTQKNDTIVISSSGGSGGTGIQGVQNNDGTLSITNPNGPVATINLQSVPLDRLAAGGASFDQVLKFNGAFWAPSSFTVAASARFIGAGTSGNPLDLASQGATSGQVLKWSGTAWVPGADNLGNLSLPYSAIVGDGGALFSVTNTGLGRVAQLAINNTSNTNAAVYATTNGSGNAGDFFKDVASPNAVLSARAGSSASGGAFAARNDGTGVTATIRNYNPLNTSHVLEVSTTGTGSAGYYQVNNSSSSAPAIEAVSNGSGHTVYSSSGQPNASAIFGFHSGTGVGATGSSPEGTGVYGFSVSQTGVRGLHNAVTGMAAGVEGKTNSATAGASAFGGATGVYGEVSSTSPGIWTAGVRGYNKGTGANGVGVIGLHDGGGFGVYGESAGPGTGVYGRSTAAGFGGYFDIPGGGAGWGVYASTAAKPGGGVWAVFSDRTMKKDIRPFADGLEIIKKINPVWYRYNGKGGMPTESEYVGIIAQDMQPLMPYALRQARGVDNSEETYLSFDASALTYIQVNAIKELAAKLEAMQKRVEQLEQQLREQGGEPGTSVIK